MTKQSFERKNKLIARISLHKADNSTTNYTEKQRQIAVYFFILPPHPPLLEYLHVVA